MKKLITALTLFALLASMAFGAGGSEEGGTQFVTIGTGGVTGIYYPVGGAISRLLNAKSDEYGIRSSVESTAGSVFNINAVVGGDLEFGIAQSDRQFQAINGIAEWEPLGPQDTLRSVFSLHPESVTLIASVESGIEGIADLAGKRVNIGTPGSGNRQNAVDAIEAFGLDLSDMTVEQVGPVEAPGLLQDGRLDAFFYTVGHPNGAITEATSGRIPVRIVSISGDPISDLIAEKPYYGVSRIPQALYPQAANSSDAATIGVGATLVSSTDVPDDVVYAVVKEVFENLDDFKALHPALGVLTVESMLQGLSAPLHPGAQRYYEEAGLIDLINPAILN
jgi:TRAP transporter TAXI family solute receptor